MRQLARAGYARFIDSNLALTIAVSTGIAAIVGYVLAMLFDN